VLYHERTNRCRTVYANRTRPLEGLLFHFSLDTVYLEDRCTARKGNAIQNRSLLRKLVMNLVRLDDDPAMAGRSQKGRQIHYCHSYESCEKMIFGIQPRRYEELM